MAKACFLRKRVFTGLVWLSTQRRSFGLKTTLSPLEGEVTISSISAKEQHERMEASVSIRCFRTACVFLQIFLFQSVSRFPPFLLPFLKVFKAF